MTLAIVPMTITAARRFVEEHHRHTKAPLSAYFAIGLAQGDEIVGCAIVGHPVARMLQDGLTCEVTRLCTLGTRNACSMLYGAAARAAKAMGYRKIVTYTLQSENGASLRASGWTIAAEVKARAWTKHKNGERHQIERNLFGERVKYSAENKWRWEREL